MTSYTDSEGVRGLIEHVDGAGIRVEPGDYVVYDPTGRDLYDCALVGRVEHVGAEFAPGSTPLGLAYVRPNGEQTTQRVTRVLAVLSP
jgi:hypothetical protein